MPVSACTRRWPRVGVLAGALLLLVSPAGRASAQGACDFGDQGNDVLTTQRLPNGGTTTYITRPHLLCDDGVQIWADSAVMTDDLSHMIGRVRYRDGSRELTAGEARYFPDVGRLQAQRNVIVTDRADGSRVENGDLVYLRQTEYRAVESMTVTTGRDGRRPRAVIPPPEPDSTAVDDSATPDSTSAPRERMPYVVVGDALNFRGEDFNATGDVEIERDSLFAYADSAEYVAERESLLLVGSARVVSADYVLVGRTILMGTDPDGANEIRAFHDALLTGEDLTLTGPQIRLYLLDGAVERLVSVPLPPEEPTEEDETIARTPDEPPTSAPHEPADSAEIGRPQRPVAVAEQFELTADSLELIAPQGAVDRIFAAGRARSVSAARDSLNVEELPEIARQDWLEGDTIVIHLKPTQRDTVALTVGSAEADTARAYEIETIVARVGARSLYRLPPQDSTAQAGVDLPAVHYVVGREITIRMLDGEVDAMEVVGQTRGIHLEPLGRTARGDPAAADSLAAPPPARPETPTGRRR